MKRDRENATRTKGTNFIPSKRYTVSDKAKPIKTGGSSFFSYYFLDNVAPRPANARFLAAFGLTRRHLALLLIASKYSLHGAPNV